MQPLPTFYERYARAICLLCAIVAPVLFYAALTTHRDIKNDVVDWLPDQFEATQRLAWYVERFGSDEILAVSWKGCTTDDPRLEEFAAKLRQPQLTSKGETTPLFEQVITGRSVAEQLSGPPLSLPPQVVAERLGGWLLGKDGKTTCAVAMARLLDDGRRDRHAAVAAARKCAKDLGISDNELWICGPTADAVAIDEAGGSKILLLAVISGLWGGLLTWLCLRRTTESAIVLATALLIWAAAISTIYFAGDSMDAVLLTMPALIFVLAISGAIHLTHYYGAVYGQTEPRLATTLAVRNGRLPCLLASTTTACGLSSLAVGSVTPVVRFGVYSTIGVLIVTGGLLFVWPAFTQLATSRLRPSGTRSEGTPWWARFHLLSTRYHRQVLLATTVIAPIFLFGVSRLQTSLSLKSLLPASSPLLRSYGWFADQIGPMIPVEIVLEFQDEREPIVATANGDSQPRSTDAARRMLARAQLVESVRQAITAIDRCGGTLAATTFTPTLPKANGARQVAVRRLAANRLYAHRDELMDMRMIRMYRGSELWRISARMPAGSSDDYGQFLTQLDTTIANTINASHPEAPQVSVCGAIPLVYMAQEQLLEDLVNSFVMAFLLIAVVMAFLLKSFAGGILSMIPNVFPALIVFGWLGLRKTPIDIGTMMTASVAIGIAVDDTLHFLVWFRRGLDRFHDRGKAVEHAFRNCATAMLQTSIICGLGTIPFIFSEFKPVARFAGVLAGLLFTALLGDLILLPAILISPFGKLIAGRNRQSHAQQPLPQHSGHTTPA